MNCPTLHNNAQLNHAKLPQLIALVSLCLSVDFEMQKMTGSSLSNNSPHTGSERQVGTQSSAMVIFRILCGNLGSV
jgi:hypothetical protein